MERMNINLKTNEVVKLTRKDGTSTIVIIIEQNDTDVRFVELWKVINAWKLSDIASVETVVLSNEELLAFQNYKYLMLEREELVAKRVEIEKAISFKNETIDQWLKTINKNLKGKNI